MRYGWLWVPLIVSGCVVSPTELREREPQMERVVAGAARDVAACISTEWGKQTGTVTTNLLPDGYVVALPHPMAGTDAVASVLDAGDGSRVLYAERMPGLSPAWMKAAVITCT